jgi:hypothetical protein
MTEEQDPIEQVKAAPAPEHKPKRNPNVAVIAGLAVFAGVAVVFALIMTLGGTGTADSQAATASSATANAALPTTPPAASSDKERAGALRRDATIQCRAAQWEKCLADLDQAKQLDPMGDGVAPIVRMRRLIAQGGAGD